LKIRASRTCLGWKIIHLSTLALLTSGSAFAQGVDAMITESHHQTGDATGVEVQYGHLFESDTDNGGNITRDSASLNINHRMRISENTGVTLAGGYQLSAYDFSGAPSPGTGGFQWDDVHEMRIVGLFDFKIDERWSIIAGGAVFSHVEGGADFDEGLTAGAAVGFNYKASENLKLGILIGAASGIEDSATLFPIPRVDWRFGERWRWRIDMFSAFGGRGVGTELSVKATDNLEIAIGIQRQRKRYRLDDHTVLLPGGTTPFYNNNGVGEESSVPVFVRLGFSPSPNFQLDVRAGVAVNGELRSETRTGTRIESDQFDATPIIGIGGHFTF